MKRILAVDDDHDVLYTLRAISEVGGFYIKTMDNGPRALELLRKEPFDLVIVDYYMPGMNGMEVVERVRDFARKIPILVLTVDESLDTAQRFMEAGATDFATKPIRVADLISRINVLLSLAESEEPLGSGMNDVPKGMSVLTLQLIMDHLEKATEPVSIDALAERAGLAYQTVHRYVSYLDQEGIVEVESVYGRVGRPLKRYFKSR